MPWVDKDKCTGCGICIEECPVGAISMENEKAEINMNECIRCGKCHEICEEKAVRHDSERIEEEIRANVEKTKRFMEHFDSIEEKQACLRRMMKFFEKERIVAEKTLAQLDSLKKDMK
jgi:ferredoxin